VAQARLLCRALCPALCRYLPHLSQFVYRRRLSSIPWRYSIHFVCILFPGSALQKLPCPPSQFFPQTGRPLRNDERVQEFCLFGPDCFRGSGCKKKHLLRLFLCAAGMCAPGSKEWERRVDYGRLLLVLVCTLAWASRVLVENAVACQIGHILTSEMDALLTGSIPAYSPSKWQMPCGDALQDIESCQDYVGLLAPRQQLPCVFWGGAGDRREGAWVCGGGGGSPIGSCQWAPSPLLLPAGPRG
jgi:hypothetical protein